MRTVGILAMIFPSDGLIRFVKDGESVELLKLFLDQTLMVGSVKLVTFLEN